VAGQPAWLDVASLPGVPDLMPCSTPPCGGKLAELGEDTLQALNQCLLTFGFGVILASSPMDMGVTSYLFGSVYLFQIRWPGLAQSSATNSS
jgi:hypothetical protein